MKARIAVALSVLAILVATTFRSGTTLPDGWTWYLASGESAFAEVIQNLLLFIPLGLSLSLAGVSLVRTVALGAVLSFSVEFAQQWIPGRDPSIGDIVCNTISSWLGAGLVRLAPRWLFTTPRRSAWQAAGTALLAVLVWFGTAAALHPTFPPPPYRMVPAPEVGDWERYTGEIRTARLAGGILTVEAVAPSRPPARTAPLAALVDAQGSRAVILAVDQSDLSLRYHMPAVRLSLQQPDLRWHDALAGVRPGDTFTASTGHDPGNVCLALNTDWRCGLGYTIGDGWKLIFYPEGWPSWRLAVINALWVAGCVIGVGFWAGRTAGGEKSGGEKDGGEGRRRAAIAKVAVGLSLLGLIVVPALTELKATSVWEWIGALGGIEVGLVLGNRARRPSPPKYSPP